MRDKSRGRSQLNALQSGLAEVLGADQMHLLASLARLRRAWPSIVGPMMSVRTEPIQLEPLPDGGFRLLVGVDHAIMAQQIRFLHQDIRKACYSHCRVKELAQIRTRVVPGAGIKPSKPRPEARPVGLADMRRVASELKSIKDRKLRRAAFRARLSQLAYGNEPGNEPGNDQDDIPHNGD